MKYTLPLAPEDKILAMSKLKAFAADNFNVAQMMHFFFDRIENFVKKGENADYQHFLLFPPQCFQKTYSRRSVKVGIMQ